MTTIGTGRRLAWSMMVFALLPGSAFAARSDRKPPTTPTNLRITAVGPYSVSLAWNPSTDNTCTTTARPCVIRTILYANQNGVNTFAVAAVDSAGNRSVLSNVISESFEGCVFLRRLPQGGVPDGP